MRYVDRMKTRAPCPSSTNTGKVTGKTPLLGTDRDDSQVA